MVIMFLWHHVLGAVVIIFLGGIMFPASLLSYFWYHHVPGAVVISFFGGIMFPASLRSAFSMASCSRRRCGPNFLWHR